VPGDVCPVRCDVRRETDIVDLFQLIRHKYGRIHVCVNNAGVLRMNGLADGNAEEWREMLDVSVSVLKRNKVKVKGKGRILITYSATYTVQPEQRALQSRNWQLIGKSQWCCGAMRPIHCPR